MADTIITAQGVSKKYGRGANSSQTYGLRDFFRELIGKASLPGLRTNEFWALRDVSFELEPGGSLALLGRNGSGKSTLLKILAGLIKKDAGSVTINGRVQALINLGAGFNPRLTGRENILNIAAVIGMNKRQSLDLMDRIIAFSELEEFIEQPVETYSSGMKARLGFAVVSHVNPDILLIDEVLAVGDMAFSNKCKLRMEELKATGVTMILVSHSLSMVKYFCDQAIWLDKGKIMRKGSVDDVCEAYEEFMTKLSAKAASSPTPLTREVFDEISAPDASGTAKFSFSHPELVQQENVSQIQNLNVVLQASKPLDLNPEVLSRFKPSFNETNHVRDLRVTLFTEFQDGKLLANGPMTAVVEGEFLIAPTALLVGVYFFHSDGLLAGFLSTAACTQKISLKKGPFVWIGSQKHLKLAPGKYILSLAIMNGTSYFFRLPVSTVEIFPRSLPVENFVAMGGIHKFYSSDTDCKEFVISKDILVAREERS